MNQNAWIRRNAPGGADQLGLAIACAGDELVVLSGLQAEDGEVALRVSRDFDGGHLFIALLNRDDLNKGRVRRAVVAVQDSAGENAADAGRRARTRGQRILTGTRRIAPIA